MRLGEILLKKGKITEQDLIEALEFQKKEKKPLGEILVEKGVVSKNDVMEALREQMTIVNSSTSIQEFFYNTAVDYGIEVSEHEQGQIQHLFWLILQRIDNFEEEIIFQKQVAKLFGLKFYSNNEKQEQFIVDSEEVSRWGIQALRESLFIPIRRDENSDNIIYLSANPFLSHSLPFNSEIVLTTRDTVGRIFSELEKQGDVIYKEADIEEFFTRIMEDAYLKGISDIHIEWNASYGQTEIKFRVEGDLQTVRKVKNMSGDFHRKLTNIVFMEAKINPDDFHRIHDRKIVAKVFKRDIGVRLSAIPVFRGQGGEKFSNIVLRLMLPRSAGTDTEGTPESLRVLGFDDEAVQILQDANRLPYGLILFCGPTGSGKTTTLYNLLKMKRREPVKILTIEDPVESIIPGINQIEVNEENNITFHRAVRSFLRSDPDVILIGEIRDKETAEEACRASLTGHLVYSTVHANTTVAVIPRLIDLGVDRQILASTLKYVIAQRLVKKLCPHCKIAVDTGDNELMKKYFGMSSTRFHEKYAEKGLPSVLYVKGDGCSRCGKDGYGLSGWIGRTVVWEILKFKDELQERLVEGKAITEDDVFRGTSLRFRDSAIKLLGDGVTTLEEIERFIVL